MKTTKFEVGDLVKIVSLDNTRKKFSTTHKMEEMLGEELRIDKVESNFIDIEGYCWDTEDLKKITEKSINFKEEYFDELNLCIERVK